MSIGISHTQNTSTHRTVYIYIHIHLHSNHLSPNYYSSTICQLNNLNLCFDLLQFNHSHTLTHAYTHTHTYTHSTSHISTHPYVIQCAMQRNSDRKAMDMVKAVALCKVKHLKTSKFVWHSLIAIRIYIIHNRHRTIHTPTATQQFNCISTEPHDFYQQL